MPDGLVRRILNRVLPPLVRRGMQAALAEELGEYLKDAPTGAAVAGDVELQGLSLGALDAPIRAAKPGKEHDAKKEALAAEAHFALGLSTEEQADALASVVAAMRATAARAGADTGKGSKSSGGGVAATSVAEMLEMWARDLGRGNERGARLREAWMEVGALHDGARAARLDVGRVFRCLEVQAVKPLELRVVLTRLDAAVDVGLAARLGARAARKMIARRFARAAHQGNTAGAARAEKAAVEAVVATEGDAAACADHPALADPSMAEALIKARQASDVAMWSIDMACSNLRRASARLRASLLGGNDLEGVAERVNFLGPLRLLKAIGAGITDPQLFAELLGVEKDDSVQWYSDEQAGQFVIDFLLQADAAARLAEDEALKTPQPLPPPSPMLPVSTSARAATPSPSPSPSVLPTPHASPSPAACTPSPAASSPMPSSAARPRPQRPLPTPTSARSDRRTSLSPLVREQRGRRHPRGAKRIAQLAICPVIVDVCVDVSAAQLLAAGHSETEVVAVPALQLRFAPSPATSPDFAVGASSGQQAHMRVRAEKLLARGGLDGLLRHTRRSIAFGEDKSSGFSQRLAEGSEALTAFDNLAGYLQNAGIEAEIALDFAAQVDEMAAVHEADGGGSEAHKRLLVTLEKCGVGAAGAMASNGGSARDAPKTALAFKAGVNLDDLLQDAQRNMDRAGT